MAHYTKYITLTDGNFKTEVLEAKQPVLVDFWAEWCGPCHAIAPVIEELAAEFEGQVKVGKLDVDKNPETATKYHIHSIPTLLFLRMTRLWIGWSASFRKRCWRKSSMRLFRQDNRNPLTK